MKTKGIEPYLREQVSRHPSCTPEDIIKQCYQAAFGAEHLLGDPQAAKDCFMQEYDATEETDIPLCERIAKDMTRVHFGAWKRTGMDPEWLFRLFEGSARQYERKDALFLSYLDEAIALFPAWKPSFDEYLRCGIRPIHHSSDYRHSKNPHYRIVSDRFARLIPLFEAIKAKEKQRSAKDAALPFLIALDGRAASGKTTAAAITAEVLDAAVIHMDDFFLPPALRTEERYRTPGGNVHYERFAKEVLPHLRNADAFDYRRFDCSAMKYRDTVHVRDTHYRIVEGSYSAHPAFGPYADLCVFVTVPEEEQLLRITSRNGAEMAERFRDRWIPLEEAYFSHFRIREHADLILD